MDSGKKHEGFKMLHGLILLALWVVHLLQPWVSIGHDPVGGVFVGSGQMAKEFLSQQYIRQAQVCHRCPSYAGLVLTSHLGRI